MSARPRLKAVHPVLPVGDVSASLAYYSRRLGFNILFTDDPQEPDYAGVGRDGVELHLQRHDPEQSLFIEKPNLRFLVSDVDALFAEWVDKGVFLPQTALRNTAWGTREFAFFDPDKIGLTFYQDL